MLRLRYQTPDAWAQAVVADLDGFLSDHAHNERKVAQTAMVLARHYPHRTELVDAMIALALEELDHFQRVHNILKERGAPLGWDQPDPYMTAIRKLCRKRDVDEYLLDRLLVFGIVEARGCERFQIVTDTLPPGQLQDFYAELTRCEARHHALFVRFAKSIYPADTVAARLDELLEGEAAIAAAQPIRAALH